MKIARDFAYDVGGSASIAPPVRLGDSDVNQSGLFAVLTPDWKVYRLLGVADADEIAIGLVVWKIEERGRSEWGVRLEPGQPEDE